MEQREMQDQAKYIWDRLDDLSATDPTAYKKFIDKQMKEREMFMSAPEPKICFISKPETEGTNFDIFVNVCGWKRIPYPSDDTEPLKFMAGFKRNYKGSKNCKQHMTIPVAANDKVLDELLKSSIDKHELVLLIIEFIHFHLKIKLSKNYRPCKELFKGDLPANPRALFIKNPQSEFSDEDIRNLVETGKTPEDILSSPETLLEKLSTKDTAPSNQKENDFVKNFMDNKGETNHKKLIEEVERTMETPDYSLVELEENDDLCHRFVLKIKLPLIQKTSDCNLTISKNEIDLKVPEKYLLKLPLPKDIDDYSSKAQFSKKSSCLTLTMPIL
ncbi:PIH1 domain-containing protein 2-like [Clavelina lepadiformis]|uniref:CS domain-containing protein n=1 Tax=Clavelina lepadiformis TaxID=159417 RepID=A0ABP0FHS5_CLALP